MIVFNRVVDLCLLQPTEEKNLPEIPILTVDVADLDAIPSKAKTALEFFGHVDILINNAGQSYRGLSSDTELDVHMRLMTVNYFGHVALTKGELDPTSQTDIRNLTFI